MLNNTLRKKCLIHVEFLHTLVFAKVLLCLGRSSREIQHALWKGEEQPDRQPVTMSTSYAWPVPLPGNKQMRWYLFC